MSDPDRKKKLTRRKVRAHRERSRSQGLRPIQLWVPNMRSPRFRDEAHRQSRAVALGSHETEDQAFNDSVSELGEA